MRHRDHVDDWNFHQHIGACWYPPGGIQTSTIDRVLLLAVKSGHSKPKYNSSSETVVHETDKLRMRVTVQKLILLQIYFLQFQFIKLKDSNEVAISYHSYANGDSMIKFDSG